MSTKEKSHPNRLLTFDEALEVVRAAYAEAGKPERFYVEHFVRDHPLLTDRQHLYREIKRVARDTGAVISAEHLRAGKRLPKKLREEEEA